MNGKGGNMEKCPRCKNTNTRETSDFEEFDGFVIQDFVCNEDGCDTEFTVWYTRSHVTCNGETINSESNLGFDDKVLRVTDSEVINYLKNYMDNDTYLTDAEQE